MKIAVIGGGAAGLMAACRIARDGADVTVIERQPRVGKKLLATGNGRCNFTNLNMSVEHYYGSFADMEAHLERFGAKRIMDEFDAIGVPGVADAQGRVYPASNAAASVLDVLRLTLAENGARELVGCEVTGIKPVKNGVELRAANEKMYFDRVLVACGGAAAGKQGGCDGGYKLMQQLGHHIVPPRPSIAPLNTDVTDLKGLKGLRARCRVKLLDGDNEIRGEEGEVLFADYGLSGICIMQLSRHVHGLKEPVISLDLAPETMEADMFGRVRAIAARPLEDMLNGLLQRRLGWNVLRAAGISDLSRLTESLSRREVSAIWHKVRDLRIAVKGVCTLENAQATMGGVDMAEVDGYTFQSKPAKHVYVAGEVCDVDGDCGGYNLHWAWSSGLAAAEAITGA